MAFPQQNSLKKITTAMTQGTQSQRIVQSYAVLRRSGLRIPVCSFGLIRPHKLRISMNPARPEGHWVTPANMHKYIQETSDEITETAQ